MNAIADTCRYRRWLSPLGTMLLATRGTGLCGLWFEGQKHHPVLSDWQPDEADAVLAQASDQLEGYFAQRLHRFSVPPDLRAGTPFQQSVWRALLQIPPGQTRTYSDIAAAIGRPQAVRAVAAAIGRNPLSIVVPCHRVLGRDGSLTGYAGGVERKAALLALEASMPCTPEGRR